MIEFMLNLMSLIKRNPEVLPSLMRIVDAAAESRSPHTTLRAAEAAAAKAAIRVPGGGT